MYVCMYVGGHICIYMYGCVCVCARVCVYVIMQHTHTLVYTIHIHLLCAYCLNKCIYFINVYFLQLDMNCMNVCECECVCE